MLQEKVNEFWSEASDNYSNIINDELNSFRPNEWCSKILTNAPKKERLNILDTGCGPGFFSIILSKEGHNVIGIDGAEGMLNVAKQNSDKYGTSPIFINMDCHKLQFCDDSFDLIVSRNVTHALCDQETVYKEWQRVLRPGGILLIFDANWHLPRVEKSLWEENKKREVECRRIYGSTFDGGKDSSSDIEQEPHVLGDKIRPDWDVELLEKLGFVDISFERNIIENLWDDKEKLLYSATPMFMIKATKVL